MKNSRNTVISMEKNGSDEVIGQPLISIRKAAVVYNQARSIFKKRPFEALKNISFDIHTGESIGVVGYNGAGKSTLLTLISGIIRPDSGEVINHGAKVALLALQAGFMMELSGRDNIILSGLALGFRRDFLLGKMDEIIEFSGIRSHIDVAVRTYSAGMRARLGFSVAHILNPDVLLIDETLGVGDKNFRAKSANAMRAKIKSEQTVVMVSHNSDTIRDLCDRVIWLDRGTIIAEGTVNDVMDKYDSKNG
jgi:lipopolysaccharide transport system ATP-binding protein